MSAFISTAKTPIPTSLRSYIREVPEFCPQAASTSKALALHCLTTRYHNIICIYHSYLDKKGTANDTKIDPRRVHRVTGVPWKRHINPKSRAADDPLVVLEYKAVHCGCHVEDVLWEFYWFKTGILTLPTLRLSETWMNTRLRPRMRGLMVYFVKTFICLRIEDIYSSKLDENVTRLVQLTKMENNIRNARIQLEKCMQQLAIVPPESDSDAETN